MLYDGRGNDRFWAGRQIGHGWNGMVELFTGFDFDGDGHNDIIGLHKDAKLFLYSGRGDGTVHYPGDYSHLVGAVSVGDWNGSGYTDVVTIGPKDELFLYSDITEGGFAQRLQIDQRWGAFTQLEMAYSTGNVHRLWAIRNDGKLYTYVWEYRGSK